MTRAADYDATTPWHFEACDGDPCRCPEIDEELREREINSQIDRLKEGDLDG